MILEDKLEEMNSVDLEELINKLKKRLKRVKEDEFLAEFHAKHFSGQSEREEE